MTEHDRESPESPVNPFAATTLSTASISASDAGLKLPPDQQRGMVGQAPIVGVLMIVQGVLDLVGCAFFAGYGLVFPTVMAEMAKKTPPGGGQAMPQFPEWVTGGMIAIGIVTGLIGILSIIAGYKVMRFEGKGLAIVALSVSLLTLLTCYCFPTSVALATYGLIFLVNQPVASAFTLRGDGYTPRQIQQAFTMQP